MATISPVPSLYRGGTSLSMITTYTKTSSQISHASTMGPLTRDSNKLKDSFRGKSPNGTRYVVRFNRQNFKVDKIEDTDNKHKKRGKRKRKSRHRKRQSYSVLGNVRDVPTPVVRSFTEPELIKFGYSARPTASGLVDPWEDVFMDHKILPKIQDKPLVSQSNNSPPKKRKGRITSRSLKEGSTMCPQFPVVSMPVKEWEVKPLTYNDVKTMRKELNKSYMKINNQDKDNLEYTRTKQDFYRMDLGKLKKVPPVSRSRMKLTYNAYLTNNRGSHQAIQECLNENSSPSTPQQSQPRSHTPEEEQQQ